MVGGDFGLSCGSRQFSSMSVGGKAQDFVSGGGLGTLPVRRQLETAGAGAGQAGCSALLLPGPKGWVIFRFKHELCLVPCESSLWEWEPCVPAESGDILGGGKKHQSRDLRFWQHLWHQSQCWVLVPLLSHSQLEVVLWIQVQLHM